MPSNRHHHRCATSAQRRQHPTRASSPQTVMPEDLDSTSPPSLVPESPPPSPLSPLSPPPRLEPTRTTSRKRPAPDDEISMDNTATADPFYTRDISPTTPHPSYTGFDSILPMMQISLYSPPFAYNQNQSTTNPFYTPSNSTLPSTQPFFPVLPPFDFVAMRNDISHLSIESRQTYLGAAPRWYEAGSDVRAEGSFSRGLPAFRADLAWIPYMRSRIETGDLVLRMERKASKGPVRTLCTLAAPQTDEWIEFGLFLPVSLVGDPRLSRPETSTFNQDFNSMELTQSRVGRNWRVNCRLDNTVEADFKLILHENAPSPLFSECIDRCIVNEFGNVTLCATFEDYKAYDTGITVASPFPELYDGSQYTTEDDGEPTLHLAPDQFTSGTQCIVEVSVRTYGHPTSLEGKHGWTLRLRRIWKIGQEQMTVQMPLRTLGSCA